MSLLSDRSIHKKLRLYSLVSVFSGLFLVALLFFILEYRYYNHEKTNLAKQVELVSTWSLPALKAEDPTRLSDRLESLNSEMHFRSVCIYGDDALSFASYTISKNDAACAVGLPSELGLHFSKGMMALLLRVNDGAKTLGHIHLIFDMSERYALSLEYARYLLLILLISFFLALFLSSSLRRLIEQPILSLVETVEDVLSEQDFSLRAEKQNDDELGQLVDRFNTMLDKIQKSQAALKESEERYDIAGRGANDGLWDWDLIADKIYFAPRWLALLGYQEGELEAMPSEWFDRVHPDDTYGLRAALNEHKQSKPRPFEYEYRMQHCKEGYRWMFCRGMVVCDDSGKAIRFAGSQTDVTDRKAVEQELRHNATHDALTGQVNRCLFLERLQDAVLRPKSDSHHFAVLFLDLDRFKVVNDSMGHAIGDHLLICVADRLKSCCYDQDTVAHFGGDEFALLIDGLQRPEDCFIVIDRIKAALDAAIFIEEKDLSISASMGVVIDTAEYESGTDLLRDAEIAMYRSKSMSSGGHQVFDQIMHHRAVDRLELERELREAIKNEEIDAYFQPIISLKDGRVVGFEALARWHHPKRGLLAPFAFVPIAEETDLIIQLDRLVLKKSCRQIKQLEQEFPELGPFSISVNMSGKQFVDMGLIEVVDQTLLETQVQPEFLHIEITETVIMNDFEPISLVIEALRKRRIHLSMDDFGTGYSSLSYLHRFPFNSLKIDRSFIMQIEEVGQRTVISSIVALAHHLGMSLVAEGIETKEQLDLLQPMSCEYGQGYLFSKPLPFSQIQNLLTEGNILHPFSTVGRNQDLDTENTEHQLKAS